MSIPGGGQDSDDQGEDRDQAADHGEHLAGAGDVLPEGEHGADADGRQHGCGAEQESPGAGGQGFANLERDQAGKGGVPVLSLRADGSAPGRVLVGGVIAAVGGVKGGDGHGVFS